jgi:putative iron-dependent peroxidase
MENAQAGIFIEGTAFNRFLEFSLKPEVSTFSLKAALKDVVQFDLENTHKPPHVVWGFGPAVATELFEGNIPNDLVDFPGYGSGSLSAVATQRDLIMWVHGGHEDDVFDSTRERYSALRDLCDLKLEIVGFKYRKDHDLIGFEDGTANPKTDDARIAAALNENSGSILLTQKWVHDLANFDSLSVPEQEKVVGRTKYENLELEGDDMPPTSHVSRTDVEVDGVAQKVYRRSAPFGTMHEHGLYFASFATALSRHDIQLKRMYGLTEDGLKDRLTEFSKAVTGSYWYVPSVSELQSLIQP